MRACVCVGAVEGTWQSAGLLCCCNEESRVAVAALNIIIIIIIIIIIMCELESLSNRKLIFFFLKIFQQFSFKVTNLSFRFIPGKKPVFVLAGWPSQYQ